jgi:hypothetical protein
MRYVLKLTDPEYQESVYIGKGSILSHGRHGWFLPESIFDTKKEATEHIQTCLNSGWYRPDITEANFEVEEVDLYPDLNTCFYYTEYEYKEFKKLED